MARGRASPVADAPAVGRAGRYGDSVRDALTDVVPTKPAGASRSWLAARIDDSAQMRIAFGRRQLGENPADQNCVLRGPHR